MAYLDENDIPRVSENTQHHNDLVERIEVGFGEIQSRLCEVQAMMPSEMQTDSKMMGMLMQCREIIEHCRERCEEHIMC